MPPPRLRKTPEPPPEEPDAGFDDALTQPRFILVRGLAPSITRLWNRRLLIGTILIEATLLVLAGLRLTFWLPPVAHWLTGEARRAVAERLAGAEIAGDMHVGWFGSVRLEDFRLAAEPGSDVPTVSAQEVKVEPELGALLHGHLRVKSIELRWVRLHPGARGEAVREIIHRLEARHSTTAGATASGAPAGESGQTPLVEVRDLYIDLPKEGATETTTLGPLSFNARWWREPSQLRWNVSGGLLEGKAGRFACAGRIEKGGRIQAHAELDKLRLVELPPGWFQGLSAQPLDGTISGELDGERAPDHSVSGNAHLTTAGLSISWPRLAAEPVAPLNLGIQGAWRWDPEARTASFHQGKIALNGGEVALETTLSLGPPRKIDVDLSVDGLDLQKTIDSLPAAFQPPPEAPRVDGTLKAELSFGGPVGNLDDIEIRKADVDLTALREAAKNDPAAEFLRRPFRYTPRDDEGPHESFEVGPGNPHYVAYSALPNYVPRAITLSEDAGFFYHHGFDFDEIKDSIARDISTGEAVRGGSTLTQQLVKNLFLSREKTLSRKIREALITLQVEATLPKWRILEIYMNTIEWGPEIYGIGHASQRYFGVPASRLSPKEAAFLATMIPSPKRFFHLYVERGSLTRAWEERVDRVLGRLHAANILDDAAYAQAMAEPLTFHHGYNREVAESPSAAPQPTTTAPSRSLWQRLFGH